MDARSRLLQDLVTLSRPRREVLDELSKYPWDSHAELVVVGPEHVGAVLAGYLAGTMSAEDVEGWANALEGRDDIGFEKASAHEIKEMIHALANPLLTERLDGQVATRMLHRIHGLRVLR